ETPPHQPVFEHASKHDPDPTGEHAGTHAVPQDGRRNVEPGCGNEGNRDKGSERAEHAEAPFAPIPQRADGALSHIGRSVYEQVIETRSDQSYERTSHR